MIIILSVKVLYAFSSKSKLIQLLKECQCRSNAFTEIFIIIFGALKYVYFVQKDYFSVLLIPNG